MTSTFVSYGASGGGGGGGGVTPTVTEADIGSLFTCPDWVNNAGTDYGMTNVTGLSVTITTVANERTWLNFLGTCVTQGTGGASIVMGYKIDSSTAVGVIIFEEIGTNGLPLDCSFNVWLPALGAGSHTIKVMSATTTSGLMKIAAPTAGQALGKMQIVQFS